MTFEQENIGLGRVSERPKFSAIIATYNRKDYLLQAVQSVVEQSYPAHEIIVVVDGSTDGSADAVRQRFPDAKVMEQPNLGRSVASNFGVAVATGDWVCFLDDDDLWHQEKLAKAARYLAENPDCLALNNPVWYFSSPNGSKDGAFGMECDFVAENLEECHRMARSIGSSKNDQSYLNIRGNSFHLMLERNRGILSASIIDRTTVLRAGGLSPMQTCGDDWTLLLNVARLCEWNTMDELLGFTRFHGTQDTRIGGNALKILNSLVGAWYGGRPLKHKIGNDEIRRELAVYGYEYKRVVQDVFWGALRAGDFRAAVAVRKFGWLLLPRLRDRVYSTLPPQITWRFERYILGRHGAKRE